MAIKRGKKRYLSDTYSFDGFRPTDEVRGIFGKPKARILPLIRRSKKQLAVNVALFIAGGMIGSSSRYEMCPAETHTYIWKLNSGVLTVGNAAR